MRISDWSSDVCSSDLAARLCRLCRAHLRIPAMAAKGGLDRGLGGEATAADPSALGDPPRIRAILPDPARAGRRVSYSELLGDLDFRVTPPPMRAVCLRLAKVEHLWALDGEPAVQATASRERGRPSYAPGACWK